MLGGDFESSRFSYPRAATDRPWAEVPVRRRCRCLDAAVGRGVGAISEVSVDGAQTCRGDFSGGGLVPVEVPAVAVDRVVSLSVGGARGVAGARWSTRWPSVPVELYPQRFAFDWTMPCMKPESCGCDGLSGSFFFSEL